MPAIAELADVWAARAQLLQWTENTFARQTKPLMASIAEWSADWYAKNGLMPVRRFPYTERLEDLLARLYDRAGRQGHGDASDEMREYAAPRFAAAGYEFAPEEALRLYAERRANLVKGLADDWFTRLKTVVGRSIQLGLSQADMGKAIRDRIAGWGMARINTIARTETMTVYGVERHRVYNEAEANGDIIGYEYAVIMDSVTSEICRNFAGKQVRAGSQYPVPPLHYGCRTLLIPVMAWERLDADKLLDGSLPMDGFGYDVQRLAA